jgi:hypothetical protein
MPTAHLTHRPAVDLTEQAVLAVLRGTPLATAAAYVGIAPADLADAVTLYQAAGRTALDTRADSRYWQQLDIEFIDWDAAEHTAVTHLRPALRQAVNSGTLAAWWYVRKAPDWRLRLRPAVPTSIAYALDHLTTQDLIRSWRPAIYEPEIPAFGGAEAMN